MNALHTGLFLNWKPTFCEGSFSDCVCVFNYSVYKVAETVKAIVNQGVNIIQNNNKTVTGNFSHYYPGIGVLVGLVFLLFVLLLFIISKKTATHQYDFDESDNKEYESEDLRIYLLFLSVTAPFTEIIIYIFNIRAKTELAGNILIGLFCLIIYYASAYINAIRENLGRIFLGLFSFYVLTLYYKVYFLPFEAITFSEWILVLIFSPFVLKTKTLYNSFLVFNLLYLLVLFLFSDKPDSTTILCFNASVFIGLLNHARKIYDQNRIEKLIIANTIINNANWVALVSDKNGKIIYCTENAGIILLRESKEIRGTQFFKYSQRFCTIDELSKGKSVSRHIQIIKGKNEESRYIEWTVSNYSNNSNLHIGQDVTDQKLVKEKYEIIVQNATDIIFEVDVDGKFKLINKAVESILGYTPEELLDKKFNTIIRRDYVAKVTHFYAKSFLQENEFEVLEFPVIAKNGSEIWISQKVNVMRDEFDSVLSYSAIARDISEVKKAEFENRLRREKQARYSEIISKLSSFNNQNLSNYNEVLDNALLNALLGLKSERLCLWKNTGASFVSIECIVSAKSCNISEESIATNKFPLLYKALAHGLPITENDIKASVYYHEFKAMENGLELKSVLGLPVNLNQELEAYIMCMTFQDYQTWDSDDVNFLRSIVDFVALSFEANKRREIEERLAFRNDISIMVSQITEQLLTSDNVHTTLTNNLKLIGETCRVDEVNVYKREHNGQLFYLDSEWQNSQCKLNKKPEKILNAGNYDELTEILYMARPYTFYVANLKDGNFKLEYQKREIISVVILPVLVKEVMYGFMTLESVQNQRLLEDNELIILQALITNLANTIERIVNEQIIKHSEANFRQLNETIRDVFWLYDVKKKQYLYISPNCEDLLGKKDSQFYNGDKDYKVNVFEEDQDLFNMASKLLLTQDSYEIEYRIKFKDGTYKWINERSFAIRNAYGELVRNSGICSDITERKLVDEEVKKLSVVAEKTINGVTITDKEGHVAWANNAYLQMFELREEDILGKRPRDVIEFVDSYDLYLIEQIQADNYKILIELFTYHTRKKMWVEIVNTKIRDINGQIGQQIEVLNNVTERELSRQTLQQYSNDLEFQSTLQKKIINAQSHEDLAYETLDYIQKQASGCCRIELFNVEGSNQLINGFKLTDGELRKVTMNTTEVKSLGTLRRGEVFLEPNLLTSQNLSISDKEEMQDGIVSYILFPVLNKNNLIGTLNVYFNHEFDLSERQVKNLESFSVLLSAALQQIYLKNELLEKNNSSIESLIYAKNIQNAILPDLKQFTNTFKEVSLYYKPRDIVSGDFYWVRDTEQRTCLVLGDCTGHGVPGAFLTFIGSRLLEQILVNDNTWDAREIMQKLDRQFHNALNYRENYFITDGMEAALCVIDKEKQKMFFVGVGIGMVYYKNNEEFIIKAHRKTVGDYNGTDYDFNSVEIDYTGDEVFNIFSDGFQDQLGGKDYRRFSRLKTLQILKSTANNTAEEREQILDRELRHHMGIYRQTDDITVLSFSLLTDKNRL